MVKLSDKYKSVYGSDEILSYIESLINNEEVIDISGCTMTEEISSMLYSYALNKGYDKVIGTDIFEDMSKRDLKSKYSTFQIGSNINTEISSIERELQKGGAYLVINSKDDLVSLTVACLSTLLIMCKYRKAEISLSNTDIKKLITTVRPLVLDELDCDCDRYITYKFGPHEITNVDKSDITSVPYWFFGLYDDRGEYKENYLKYFNKLKSLYINIQTKTKEIYSKRLVSDVIKEGVA